MALFETPSKSPVERVSAASGRVASAPGTWVLIGENVDHFGGVTLAGTASLRAAAAVLCTTQTHERARCCARRAQRGQISRARLWGCP